MAPLEPGAMPAQALHEVPFFAALRFWLKLGFISFGGPAGQIAIMHRELVQERRWISEKRFLHALNYCMVLPGPEAQQLATYLGWLMHRTWGGVLAGLLFVLPSLALLVGLSWVYVAFGQVSWVAGLLYGIKPAVAALVLQAVHRMGRKTLKTPATAPLMWAVATLSFVATALLGTPFPWVLLAAALTGWLVQRRIRAPTNASARASAVPASTHLGALIDDHTPPPAHARFSQRRLLKVIGVGALLWLLPMAGLIAWQGADSTLVQMGWFFTKAALLTFGGAYAVLPYVYQGAVEHFGWLTATQMMDGLALGETTPGPLIMVVAFVGFLGGWAKAVLGSGALFLGGALAALVVSWFTFLPSFLFILAGGPLVESTHGQARFTASMSAITAAVVGVITSLALFFFVHIADVAGPGHLANLPVDVLALGLSALAALALIRYQWGVITVILCSAVLGAAARWAGWA